MISIIIIGYRYNHIKRLKAVINSILKNRGEEIEILLVTNQADVFKNILKIKIIEVKLEDKYKNNLGLYRNIAAKYAESEYLYFTDEDIIIYDPSYFLSLKKIARKNDESIIIWPTMYRLDRGIEKFCEDFVSGKKLKFHFDYGHYIYGYGENCFYKIQELKEEFDGIPHVCKPEEYSKLKKAEIMPEELVWKPSIHWGGIFCRKDFFESVGGFSLSYFNWGCEDDDLIWKLSKKYNIIYLFKEFPNLAVLHLEHPRKYRAYYRKNMYIFEKRKHKGINSAISEDKKMYDSISKNLGRLLGG